jgi:hypothetical protein
MHQIQTLAPRLFEIISGGGGEVDLFAKLSYEQVETIYTLIDEDCPHWTQANLCDEFRLPIHDIIAFPAALPVLKYHCQNNREEDFVLSHSFLAFATYSDYNSLWPQIEICLKYSKFEKIEQFEDFETSSNLVWILAQNCQREEEISKSN